MSGTGWPPQVRQRHLAVNVGWGMSIAGLAVGVIGVAGATLALILMRLEGHMVEGLAKVGALLVGLAGLGCGLAGLAVGVIGIVQGRAARHSSITGLSIAALVASGAAIVGSLVPFVWWIAAVCGIAA